MVFRQKFLQCLFNKGVWEFQFSSWKLAFHCSEVCTVKGNINLYCTIIYPYRKVFILSEYIKTYLTLHIIWLPFNSTIIYPYRKVFILSEYIKTYLALHIIWLALVNVIICYIKLLNKLLHTLYHIIRVKTPWNTYANTMIWDYDVNPIQGAYMWAFLHQVLST